MAQSPCQHIIERFLKLEYSGPDEPADHWRDEIVERRSQLEQILTHSIEAKIDLPARYKAALRLVRCLERDVPGLMGRLPVACPYTLAQIVGTGDAKWFPPPRTSRPSGRSSPRRASAEAQWGISSARRFSLALQCRGSGFDPLLELGHDPVARPSGRYRLE